MSLPLFQAAEIAFLRRFMGGGSTDVGTPDHERAESLCERGLLKEVMIGEDRFEWRLSAQGCALAYGS